MRNNKLSACSPALNELQFCANASFVNTKNVNANKRLTLINLHAQNREGNLLGPKDLEIQAVHEITNLKLQMWTSARSATKKNLKTKTRREKEKCGQQNKVCGK